MPMSRARVWNVSCWRIATNAKSTNASTTIAQAAWTAFGQRRVEASRGPCKPTSEHPDGGTAASETPDRTVDGSAGELGTTDGGTGPDYRPPSRVGARITTLSRTYPLGGGCTVRLLEYLHH